MKEKIHENLKFDSSKIKQLEIKGEVGKIEIIGIKEDAPSEVEYIYDPNKSTWQRITGKSKEPKFSAELIEDQDMLYVEYCGTELVVKVPKTTELIIAANVCPMTISGFSKGKD